MTTIVAPPSNASKWQMGFNSAFKGLMITTKTMQDSCRITTHRAYASEGFEKYTYTERDICRQTVNLSKMCVHKHRTPLEIPCIYLGYKDN
jgi:hypothetical protein